MIPLIAFQRGPSRISVFPGGRTGTDRRTMAGGRDKRRGTRARYAVVSTRVFASRCQWGSAASWLKRLICRNFHRAVVCPGSAAP